MPDIEVLDEKTGEITIAQEEPKAGENAVAVVEPKQTAAAPAGEKEPRTKLGMFYVDMKRQREEIERILPKHIDVDLFQRVLYTAVQLNPRLLDSNPQHLWNAVMMAAQDGLLPDGKEGAIVPRFGSGPSLTWQPMIAGIRKKARNSGEVEDWRVEAVYENDFFEREMGDNPRITHRPPRLGLERGQFIGAYSICTLKGGNLNREVMDREEIERIRDRSDAYKAFKAKKITSTPWDSDFDEMGKKSVARRHAKQLPLSRDLSRIVNRDDALFFDHPTKDSPDADTVSIEGHKIVRNPLADDVPAGEAKQIEQPKPAAEPKPKKEKAPAKEKPKAQEPPPPTEEPAGPGVAQQGGIAASDAPSQPAAATETLTQSWNTGGAAYNKDANHTGVATGAPLPGAVPPATKELLVNYGKALTRAQSEKSLAALDAQYFAAHPRPTDEPTLDALREIFGAHIRRCRGEIEIGAMDQIIAVAIGRLFP